MLRLPRSQWPSRLLFSESAVVVAVQRPVVGAGLAVPAAVPAAAVAVVVSLLDEGDRLPHARRRLGQSHHTPARSALRSAKAHRPPTSPRLQTVESKTK